MSFSIMNISVGRCLFKNVTNKIVFLIRLSDSEIAHMVRDTLYIICVFVYNAMQLLQCG